MGGNVFPGKNRRYSREEYFDLIGQIDLIFKCIFKKWNVAPALKDKESFGDMDVVGVPSIEFSSDKLKNAFQTEYVKRNGEVWSLIYKEFQIDLITTNDEEYNFCSNYIGLSDRGNFIGKIAHQLGLKFGHDGLWMPVRLSDSHKLGDILLTRDPIRAEKFLDIVPMKEANNFQEIFDNISASKYFNPAIFDLENNSAISRIRDRKRPSYHRFLELCKELHQKNWFIKSKDKNFYHGLIFDEFTHAHKAFRILMAKKEELDAVNLKFNGNLVKECTNLEGKNLGQFMIYLKDKLSRDMILTLNTEEIKEKIVNFYKEFVIMTLSQNTGALNA